MGWMTDLPLSELTTLQAEVRAEAVSGPRGKMPAPMTAWLRCPELARPAQQLGAALRFQGVLAPELRELAILVCARHWTSHHEWTAHLHIAREVGLNEDIIAGIARAAPPPKDGSNHSIVWSLSLAILRDGQVAEPARAEALAKLGERGLVELVTLVGYYTLVALTLNVFEIGLPDSLAPELLNETNQE